MSGHNIAKTRLDSSCFAKYKGGAQIHIAEFDGKMEAEEFLDWLDSMESYFDWKEVPEERKVKLVGTKLWGQSPGIQLSLREILPK